MYEFILAKHKVKFLLKNPAHRIITPSLFGKLKELRLLDNLKATDVRLSRNKLH
jgi:hypothetical protein